MAAGRRSRIRAARGGSVRLDTIRYDPGIFVTDLELESAVRYLKKTYADGRARRLGNRIIAIKALTTAEQLRVFRETVREEPLSAINASMLLALLIVGVGCWYGGNLSGNVYRGDASQ
jgi:hypothetical protein